MLICEYDQRKPSNVCIFTFIIVSVFFSLMAKTRKQKSEIFIYLVMKIQQKKK